MGNLSGEASENEVKAQVEVEQVSAVVVVGTRVSLTYRITEESEQRLTESGEIRIL
jgi:hypothetical protein